MISFRDWINIFKFFREAIHNPAFSGFINREYCERNLYLIAFLGMFLLFLFMSEQAVVYSTEKHQAVLEVIDLKEELNAYRDLEKLLNGNSNPP